MSTVSFLLDFSILTVRDKVACLRVARAGRPRRLARGVPVCRQAGAEAGKAEAYVKRYVDVSRDGPARFFEF